MQFNSLSARGILGMFIVISGLCSCLQAQTTLPDSVLETAISDQNPATIARIQANKPVFIDLLSKVFAENSDLIVLVDKKHDLPENYVPPDLVKLTSLRPKIVLNSGRNPLQLRSILIKDLQAMIAAAKKDGVTIVISSTYRDFEYQKNLFARYVKELGKPEAERESAHAGSSQHQLGLAMDFGSITPEFATTPAGKWLAKHAGTFGFSLSYPEGQEHFTGYMYEPWHWRYIGVAAVSLQKQFFDDSQQALLLFLHEHGDSLRTYLQKH